MKVSIALCTWNGSRFIEPQLRSLLSQERLPDELVLRDDGSTDNTLEIASDILSNAPFHVDIRRNDRNLGSTKNFESALLASSGDVLLPCDQDDVWQPAKIRRCVETLEATGADLVFHDSRLVEGTREPGSHWSKLSATPALLGKFLTTPCQSAILLHQPIVTGCCMAIRKAAFDLTVPFDKNWIHDEWMALALALRGGRLHPISEMLVDYRVHPVQQVGIANTRLLAKIERILEADKEAYLKEVEKLRTLEDFLVSVDSSERSLNPLRGKIEHNLVRSRMGDAREKGRWAAIWREFSSGRYKAYSWWRLAPAKDAFRVATSSALSLLPRFIER
jgi:glycosyltransferase involved in cell wall biosynthesis